MTKLNNDRHWYAFKVFFGKGTPLKDYFDDKGLEYFYDVKKAVKTKSGETVTMDVPVIPSLIFLFSTRTEAEKTEQLFLNKVMLYRYTNARHERVPSTISKREIDIFRIVAQSGVEGLDFYDEYVEKYTKGDRVRVTDGPFKGAEGYIVRIKKNRHLYVCITGFCAVVTGYVPKAYLEKMEG